MTNRHTADLHRMAAEQRADDAQRVKEFNEILGVVQQASAHVDDWRNHILSEMDVKRQKMKEACIRIIDEGFQDMARSFVAMNQSISNGLIPAMNGLAALLDKYDEKPDRAK